jgi:myo-inositol-1(or 4)-monophosphatase
MHNKLLKLAIHSAQKAGELALKEINKNFKVTEKAKNDLVTNVDFACQKLIIKEIKKVFPSHAILAEEGEEGLQKKTFLESIKASVKASKYIWIIDPIDGTSNFVHRLPLYGISIGIMETKSVKASKNYEYLEGEIVAGAIYIPPTNELFYAAKGKGAFLNKKKIKVSPVKSLEKSLVVTCFPPKYKKINLPYFTKMLAKTQSIRSIGSAAIEFCYTAAGRIDGFWAFGLKPWDVAAGALIVKEAGGRITDTNGNLLDLFGQDTLATNGKIHKEMVNSFSHMRS